MKWFKRFRKADKQEASDAAFIKNGFVKKKDSKKKLCVDVQGIEYQFEFETNRIYEIPAEQLKFAICIQGRERFLFVNKDYILLKDTTSPYRTFYEGLMKEPFKFSYPFKEQVIIETKDNVRLKFWVQAVKVKA